MRSVCVKTRLIVCMLLNLIKIELRASSAMSRRAFWDVLDRNLDIGGPVNGVFEFDSVFVPMPPELDDGVHGSHGVRLSETKTTKSGSSAPETEAKSDLIMDLSFDVPGGSNVFEFDPVAPISPPSLSMEDSHEREDEALKWDFGNIMGLGKLSSSADPSSVIPQYIPLPSPNLQGGNFEFQKGSFRISYRGESVLDLRPHLKTLAIQTEIAKIYIHEQVGDFCKINVEMKLVKHIMRKNHTTGELELPEEHVDTVILVYKTGALLSWKCNNPGTDCWIRSFVDDPEYVLLSKSASSTAVTYGNVAVYVVYKCMHRELLSRISSRQSTNDELCEYLALKKSRKMLLKFRERWDMAYVNSDLGLILFGGTVIHRGKALTARQTQIFKRCWKLEKKRENYIRMLLPRPGSYWNPRYAHLFTREFQRFVLYLLWIIDHLDISEDVLHFAIMPYFDEYEVFLHDPVNRGDIYLMLHRDDVYAISQRFQNREISGHTFDETLPDLDVALMDHSMESKLILKYMPFQSFKDEFPGESVLFYNVVYMRYLAMIGHKLFLQLCHIGDASQADRDSFEKRSPLYREMSAVVSRWFAFCSKSISSATKCWNGESEWPYDVLASDCIKFIHLFFDNLKIFEPKPRTKDENVFAESAYFEVCESIYRGVLFLEKEEEDASSLLSFIKLPSIPLSIATRVVEVYFEMFDCLFTAVLRYEKNAKVQNWIEVFLTTILQSLDCASVAHEVVADILRRTANRSGLDRHVLNVLLKAFAKTTENNNSRRVFSPVRYIANLRTMLEKLASRRSFVNTDELSIVYQHLMRISSIPAGKQVLLEQTQRSLFFLLPVSSYIDADRDDYVRLPPSTGPTINGWVIKMALNSDLSHLSDPDYVNLLGFVVAYLGDIVRNDKPMALFVDRAICLWVACELIVDEKNKEKEKDNLERFFQFHDNGDGKKRIIFQYFQTVMEALVAEFDTKHTYWKISKMEVLAKAVSFLKLISKKKRDSTFTFTVMSDIPHLPLELPLERESSLCHQQQQEEDLDDKSGLSIHPVLETVRNSIFKQFDLLSICINTSYGLLTQTVPYLLEGKKSPILSFYSEIPSLAPILERTVMKIHGNSDASVVNFAGSCFLSGALDDNIAWEGFCSIVMESDLPAICLKLYHTERKKLEKILQQSIKFFTTIFKVVDEKVLSSSSSSKPKMVNSIELQIVLLCGFRMFRHTLTTWDHKLEEISSIIQQMRSVRSSIFIRGFELLFSLFYTGRHKDDTSTSSGDNPLTSVFANGLSSCSLFDFSDIICDFTEVWKVLYSPDGDAELVGVFGRIDFSTYECILKCLFPQLSLFRPPATSNFEFHKSLASSRVPFHMQIFEVLVGYVACCGLKHYLKVARSEKEKISKHKKMTKEDKSLWNKSPAGKVYSRCLSIYPHIIRYIISYRSLPGPVGMKLVGLFAEGVEFLHLIACMRANEFNATLLNLKKSPVCSGIKRVPSVDSQWTLYFFCLIMQNMAVKSIPIPEGLAREICNWSLLDIQLSPLKDEVVGALSSVAYTCCFVMNHRGQYFFELEDHFMCLFTGILEYLKTRTHNGLVRIVYQEIFGANNNVISFLIAFAANCSMKSMSQIFHRNYRLRRWLFPVRPSSIPPNGKKKEIVDGNNDNNPGDGGNNNDGSSPSPESPVGQVVGEEISDVNLLQHIRDRLLMNVSRKEKDVKSTIRTIDSKSLDQKEKKGTLKLSTYCQYLAAFRRILEKGCI